MLLRIQSHNERWHVDNLLANSDVTLVDEHSGVVNRLRETRLEDLGLQSTLQKVLELKSQYVVQPEYATGT